MFETIKEFINAAPEPQWIKIAKNEIGTKEVPGEGNNPRILEYHSACTLHATEDSVAWCSAFVNWCMWKCGLARTHAANARSWLGYAKPLPGFRKYAIVVFRRGGNAWQGHVAFAIEDRGEHVYVLGGNQSDQVCYAEYRKDHVLGYVWPHSVVV